MGMLPPVTVKPVPLIVAELIVTAEVPVDVRVTVLVLAVFIVTLPKLRLLVLTVNWGAETGPWGV